MLSITFLSLGGEQEKISSSLPGSKYQKKGLGQPGVASLKNKTSKEQQQSRVRKIPHSGTKQTWVRILAQALINPVTLNYLLNFCEPQFQFETEGNNINLNHTKMVIS